MESIHKCLEQHRFPVCLRQVSLLWEHLQLITLWNAVSRGTEANVVSAIPCLVDDASNASDMTHTSNATNILSVWGMLLLLLTFIKVFRRWGCPRTSSITLVGQGGLGLYMSGKVLNRCTFSGSKLRIRALSVATWGAKQQELWARGDSLQFSAWVGNWLWWVRPPWRLFFYWPKWFKLNVARLVHSVWVCSWKSLLSVNLSVPWLRLWSKFTGATALIVLGMHFLLLNSI